MKTNRQLRIKRLLEMLSTQPQDSFLLFALAKEYSSESKWEKAIEYFETIYDIDPEYIGLYYHYSQALIHLDKISEAIRFIQLGIQQTDKIGDHKNKAELVQLKESIIE